jgi:hypothetical protein
MSLVKTLLPSSLSPTLPLSLSALYQEGLHIGRKAAGMMSRREAWREASSMRIGHILVSKVATLWKDHRISKNLSKVTAITPQELQTKGLVSEHIL